MTILFVFNVSSFAVTGDYEIKYYNNKAQVDVPSIFGSASGSGSEQRLNNPGLVDNLGIDYEGFGLSTGVKCAIGRSLNCSLEVGVHLNWIQSDNFYNQNILADVGIENNAGKIDVHRIQYIENNQDSKVDIFQFGANVVLPLLDNKSTIDSRSPQFNVDFAYGNKVGALGAKIDSNTAQLTGLAKLFLENGMAPRVEFSKASGISFGLFYDQVGHMLNEWKSTTPEGTQVVSLKALEQDGLSAHSQAILLTKFAVPLDNFNVSTPQENASETSETSTLEQVEAYYSIYRTRYDALLAQLEYFPDNPASATAQDWALFHTPDYWIQSIEYDQDFSAISVDFFSHTYNLLRYYVRTRIFAESLSNYYPYDYFAKDNRPNDYRQILLAARNLGGTYQPKLDLNTTRETQAFFGQLGNISSLGQVFDQNIPDVDQVVQPTVDKLFFSNNHNVNSSGPEHGNLQGFSDFDLATINSQTNGQNWIFRGKTVVVFHEMLHNVGYPHRAANETADADFLALQDANKNISINYNNTQKLLKVQDVPYASQGALHNTMLYGDSNLEIFYKDGINMHSADYGTDTLGW